MLRISVASPNCSGEDLKCSSDSYWSYLGTAMDSDGDKDTDDHDDKEEENEESGVHEEEE